MQPPLLVPPACHYKSTHAMTDTRETLITAITPLLAAIGGDAVEAASRTLTDPTPARTRGMVQKIINNIFIDGQLDECELSLKDMHMIAKSFERVLGGIFHHLVDYPEPVHKERVTEKKNGNDTNRERPAGSSDKNGKVKKSSSDDLKRLGMS